MKKSLATFLLGLLILPVLGLISALLGWIPLDAQGKPPEWEKAIARRALDASLARRAAGIKNPLPISEDVLLAGMKLYRFNCSGCHGDYKQPSPWGTKNFYPRVPQFAEKPSDLTAEEMFTVVKHGVRYSGMAGWEGLIPESEMWKVVTFLSHLKSLPPKVEAIWTARRS